MHNQMESNSKEAIDKMKEEIMNELGFDLNKSYNKQNYNLFNCREIKSFK